MVKSKGGKSKNPPMRTVAGKSPKASVANVNKELEAVPCLTAENANQNSADIQVAKSKAETQGSKSVPQKVTRSCKQNKTAENSSNLANDGDLTANRSRSDKLKEACKTTFVEDNDMSIDADPEDSHCYSEDEEKLEPDYTDGAVEDEVSSDENINEPVKPGTSPQKSPKVTRLPLINKEKLCALDLEMKQKSRDIRQIMSEGGLTETVQYMSENFGLGKNCRQTTGDKPESTKRKHLELNNHKKSISSGLKAMNLNENESLKSIETIHRNAVEKRTSSSLEDCIDISDDSIHFDHDHCFVDQIPGTSDDRWNDMDAYAAHDPPNNDDTVRRPCEPTPEEKADQVIRDVEAAKAKIFPSPGNTPMQPLNNHQLIAQIDEDYLMVGNHIDDLTRAKIVKGEYIDFSKLLPKDKILVEEDGRIVLVVRNGRTYWVPVSESINIDGFPRWEQAFRIYSNIYMSAHPQKAGELIQYNHVIHSISLSYTWENVYSYDKEFRLHLSKHPQCSWAIILYRAIFLTAYYGLFRIGELTDSAHAVKAEDVHVGVNKDKPMFVLHTSKTHNRGSKPQIIKISKQSITLQTIK